MASSSDFYYYITIPDTSFNDDIIALIDSREDEQNFSTNIKAKMTSWYLQDESAIQGLKKIILDFAKIMGKERYKKDMDFKFQEMWGVSYKSEEYAVTHSHWPATWVACYYMNPSKKCAGLYFNDLNEELKIENGMLVLFPGWMRHEVKSQQFEGTRYVISANLHLKE